MRPVYVAKKAAAVADPYAYGWLHSDPPAGAPPQTPTFRLVMPVAGAFTIPTLAVECFVVRDEANTSAHDGKTLRLSASIAGVTVRMKRAGDGFADSIDFAVAPYGGGRSGFSQSLDFDLAVADLTKTLTLSVSMLTETLTATATSVVSNVAPTVTIAAVPATGGAPLTVTFTPTIVHPDIGQTITYDWDFNDGTAHSTAAAPVHVYAANGVYNPVCTVSDGYESGNGTTPVTVATPYGHWNGTAAVSKWKDGP